MHDEHLSNCKDAIRKAIKDGEAIRDVYRIKLTTLNQEKLRLQRKLKIEKKKRNGILGGGLGGMIALLILL
jgi:hypothetical protein